MRMLHTQPSQAQCRGAVRAPLWAPWRLRPRQFAAAAQSDSAASITGSSSRSLLGASSEPVLSQEEAQSTRRLTGDAGDRAVWQRRSLLAGAVALAGTAGPLVQSSRADMEAVLTSQQEVDTTITAKASWTTHTSRRIVRLWFDLAPRPTCPGCLRDLTHASPSLPSGRMHAAGIQSSIACALPRLRAGVL